MFAEDLLAGIGYEKNLSSFLMQIHPRKDEDVCDSQLKAETLK